MAEWAQRGAMMVRKQEIKRAVSWKHKRRRLHDSKSRKE